MDLELKLKYEKLLEKLYKIDRQAGTLKQYTTSIMDALEESFLIDEEIVEKQTFTDITEKADKLKNNLEENLIAKTLNKISNL